MRMRHRLSILAGAALLAAAALPAAAAPLTGEALRARVAGAEFRGQSGSGRGFGQVIWRFGADGGVRASTYTRIGSALESQTVEARDTGQWRIDGDRLCIAWQVAGATHCYTADAGAGSQVRLLGGPALLDGQLSQ